MERGDIRSDFRQLVRALRHIRCLQRRTDRRQRYSDANILAIYFWAVLNERPVSWACEPRNRPPNFRRANHPDQSTMSRRLRTPIIRGIIDALPRLVMHHGRPAKMAYIDGKPLEISQNSRDPDAINGYSIRRMSKGYKLHALVDEDNRLLAFEITPMNKSEPKIAQRLFWRAHRLGLLAKGARIIGDAGYDTNALHRVARKIGVEFYAPRRKPGTGLGHGTDQEPGRLRSIEAFEHDERLALELRSRRAQIEHFFGALCSRGGGLQGLVSWARRIHRTRAWVAVKLAINAIRVGEREATKRRCAA